MRVSDESIDSELLARLLDADFRTEVPLSATASGDDFTVFPLTDIQRSYFMGRNAELVLGGSSCQFYYEVDCVELDIAKYQVAWQQVIQRHPMLRAVILDASEQKILKDVPDLILPVHDLRREKDVSSVIEGIRQRLTQVMRPSDQWPLFDVEVSRLVNGHVRIHLGLDLLIIDLSSILIVMQEVAMLYRDPKRSLPPLDYSFRNYVIDSAQLQDSPWQQARVYWLKRLPDLPDSPQLPLLSPLHEIAKPEYQRITRQLNGTTWSRVKDLAADLGMTPACILLALFAEVLSQRVEGESVEGEADPQHFCLNMTLFNRQPLHADINKIVGDFTTNFLFAVDLRQKKRRREFFKQVQADLWRSIEHSAFSGIEVMSEMARHAGHLEPPLMPVIFTCALSQADTALFNSASTQLGTPVFHAGQTPQAILDSQLVEWDGQLQINWDITTNALDIDLANQLFDHYLSLITAFSANEQALDCIVADLPDPDENLILLTAEGLSNYTRLSDLWLESLPENLERPALKTSMTNISHQQLAEQVSGICWRLSEVGVSEGDTVCIAVAKSAEQIATCLAVSVIGAVYVPIDTEQPEARIEKIVSELQPRLIISTQDDFGKASGLDGIAQLNISANRYQPRDLNELFSYPKATEDALAYIIYTSGSTGMPKGVCLNHQSSINTCLDINQRFGLTADDCVFALSALHFDLSVYDIFGVLGTGGSIALPDLQDLQNPTHWLEICQQCDVTLWNSVPALWSLFVGYLKLNPDKRLPEIRISMLSGDWIPLPLVPDTREIFPQLDFYSLGGATEAAIWSIYSSIEQLDPTWKSVPYGKALAGQQVFVLNKELQIALPGQTGDIYIAGIGLATGYYNDPDKTAQHFFKHPRTGLSLYRTGDLGCYYPDGNIEFKGRLDNQLKINGYRVELGEISRNLLNFDTVSDAIVIPVEVQNTTQLAAFIKVDEQVSTLPAETIEGIQCLNWDGLGELKYFLVTQLPVYMIPAQWCVVSDWPLTDNGKLNMPVLKSVASQAVSEQTNAAVLPVSVKSNTVSNETNHNATLDAIAEEVLAIVAEVLKRDQIGLDDNLVSLGASSLELIELASRIEKLSGQRPPLPELAKAVQLSDLVALVRELAPSEGYVTPLFPEENVFRRYLEKMPVITDADSRSLFKAKQQAPTFLGETVELNMNTERENSIKSWRGFSSLPSSLEQVSQLLDPLRQYYVDGRKKRHYASAGALYPIEVYLIREGEKIQGLKSGGYFYDADAHALQTCNPSLPTRKFAELSGRNGDWLNNAHFLVCLVLRMDSIVPLYEAASLPFALIECGAICQLLEQDAMSAGLGLCQVGDMSLARIGEQLGLTDDRICLHVLAGGAIDVDELQQWQQQSANYSQVITESEL